jgi:hypothetical protein
MTDRYAGKVVSISDEFTVIINKGRESGIVIGDKFLIIGLGEIIVDPDTQEELEQLEIVRGKAVVTHVQEKISTLQSCEYEKSPDEREIKKVTSRDGIAKPRAYGYGGIYGLGLYGGSPDTETELIKPGKEHLKELKEVHIGDCIIKT